MLLLSHGAVEPSIILPDIISRRELFMLLIALLGAFLPESLFVKLANSARAAHVQKNGELVSGAMVLVLLLLCIVIIISYEYTPYIYESF